MSRQNPQPTVATIPPPEAFGGIKVISFDLDDTLWDCAPAIHHAEAELFRWFEQHAPRISANNSLKDLYNHRRAVLQDRPELAVDVTASRTESIRRLLIEYDYPAQQADSAFEVFYLARSQVTLYPGVVSLLQGLRQHYRLAAITNGNADLDVIGIAEHFDDIQCASLTAPPKPAADMFQRCLQRFAIDQDALLHIGDNPETDVGGAHNAGVQTLWFNQHGERWPQHLQAPHHEASSIDELHSLLVN